MIIYFLDKEVRLPSYYGYDYRNILIEEKDFIKRSFIRKKSDLSPTSSLLVGGVKLFGFPQQDEYRTYQPVVKYLLIYGSTRRLPQLGD